MTFSAVILAGGASSRMGRDKAWLEIGGKPLLIRQVECAQATGAREVFISGRPGTDYSATGRPVLLDAAREAGPLAGIERALTMLRDPLLLVLAVDMPHLTCEFLKSLWTECRAGAGVVPQHDEILEPLAAWYPKAAGEVLRKLLAGRNAGASAGAKHLAKVCAGAGLVRLVAVPAAQAGVFKSWNSPADLAMEMTEKL